MDNLNLTNLRPKESCKVKAISGGCKARKRLYELGLNKGAEVKMVKNDFGPLILNLSGNKLALGRGLASNILIEI